MSGAKIVIIRGLFGIVVPFMVMYFWGVYFPIIDTIPAYLYVLIALMLLGYVWGHYVSLPANVLAAFKADIQKNDGAGKKAPKWLNALLIGLPLFLAVVGIGATVQSAICLFNAKMAQTPQVQEISLVSYKHYIRSRKRIRFYHHCFFDPANPHNRRCVRVTETLYQKIPTNMPVLARTATGAFDLRWIQAIRHPDAELWERPQLEPFQE